MKGASVELPGTILYSLFEPLRVNFLVYWDEWFKRVVIDLREVMHR